MAEPVEKKVKTKATRREKPDAMARAQVEVDAAKVIVSEPAIHKVTEASQGDDYAEFCASKLGTVPPSGFDPVSLDYKRPLFDFHEASVRWGLRRGKAAFFYGTGLGKTAMQVACADQVHRHTGGDVLILAPLAVASQTVREADEMGVAIRYCQSPDEMMPGITITNYDRLKSFLDRKWAGVLLDESSILKNETGATRNAIIDGFKSTPYRFEFSATPAPNDFTELGNHAQFLGVCSLSEMLATYFVHDGGSVQDWRLKGHAVEPFWRWVATWGALVTHPRDIGFDGAGYDLPPLQMHEHIVPANEADVEAQRGAGQLSMFAQPAATLTEQRKAKRSTLDRRCQLVADIVAEEPHEPWVIWGDLNDECDLVQALLNEKIGGCVQIAGSDKRDVKEQRMIDFTEGRIKYLVTKAKIAGYGLNWQHCARTIMVGATHKWEEFFQSVRRFWRFGQKRPVHVHVVSSELEARVLENFKRKDQESREMTERLRVLVGDHVRKQIDGARVPLRVDLGSVDALLPPWLVTREGDPCGLEAIDLHDSEPSRLIAPTSGSIDVALPSWLATVGG